MAKRNSNNEITASFCARNFQTFKITNDVLSIVIIILIRLVAYGKFYFLYYRVRHHPTQVPVEEVRNRAMEKVVVQSVLGNMK